VHFYNKRQLRKRDYPNYPAYITDALTMRL
jgi:hypothetical protein